jgi:prepilin-type N-terminal cleavage/methylation domain-containing protein
MLPVRKPIHRQAFTLVELLVVIVVLAILVGLLVPAVMRAVSTAKEASTSAELNALAQALADFRSRFGSYPPSRIVLSESGDYSPGTLGAAAGLGPRSVTALRRMFPRVLLSTSGPTRTMKGADYYDFNASRAPDATPYVLSGFECLVYFLGGMPMPTKQGLALVGFAKDPTNPFQGAVPPPPPWQQGDPLPFPYSPSRTTPLREFRPGYLDDAIAGGTSGGQNGLPEYRDTLGGRKGTAEGLIAYFSAYEGAGYDPDDCNVAEPDDSGSVAAVRGQFMTGNSPLGAGVITSPAPNPYLSDAPVDTTSRRPRAYINPQSFQLISPGRDFLFGIGGEYDKQSPGNKLPFVPSTTAIAGQGSITAEIRNRERDNLTNFSGGRLD